MESSITVRVGRGAFNDFVIDQDSVFPEHCNIILDSKGVHVYRVSRDASVFINNKVMENRYADISLDDEIRVGTVVIPFKDACSGNKRTEEASPQCPHCGNRNVVFKTKIDKTRFAIFFLVLVVGGCWACFIFLPNRFLFYLVELIIPLDFSILLRWVLFIYFSVAKTDRTH